MDRHDVDHGHFWIWLSWFLPVLEVVKSECRGHTLARRAIRFGTSLIILGILATIFASVSHLITLRRLEENELPVLTHWPLSVTVALLVAVAGLAGLWALFAG
jgi:hypothetical protein